MVRVNQCCCGCSLRAGTLIILWLTLVVSIFTAIKYMGALGSVRNGFGESYCYYLILSSLLQLFLSGLALWGINEKKPGHMMPYIGYSVFGLILGCIILLVFLFASTYIINSGLFDGMVADTKRSNTYHSYERTDESMNEAKSVMNSVVLMIGFAYALGLALQAYFTIVVYSYYHTLKEQVKGAGGIIYGMPPEQGNTNVTGGAPYVYPTTYGQQPACYPPQQPTSYPPPAFGQQPAAYPPSYGQQPGMYPQVPDQKV